MSREELLEAVAEEVAVCRRCKLWKTRRNAVLGEGNPNSQIMFIGEAPGYWEDIKGKPFVGAAGRFLDTLLCEAGLSRETVFIGNVLKCRPPRNREPLSNEIEKCGPYLDDQIQIIQPKFIITLGSCSTAYIFSKAALQFDGVTRSHGRFYEASISGFPVTIFPTFHPAAALYRGKYKELLQQDFRLLKRFLAEKRPSL